MKKKGRKRLKRRMNPLNEFDLKTKIETIISKLKDLEEFLGKEIKVSWVDEYEVEKALEALGEILGGISAMVVMTRINVDELMKYPFGRYNHWNDLDPHEMSFVEHRDPITMTLDEHEAMGKVLKGIKAMLWMIEGRVCATYTCTDDFCCDDQRRIEMACDEIEAVRVLLTEKLKQWHKEVPEDERKKIYGFRDDEIIRFRDQSERCLLGRCRLLTDSRRIRRTRKWVTGFELSPDYMRMKETSPGTSPHNPEVSPSVKKNSGASHKVRKEGD
jgi:hypothetical protein